MSQVLLNLNDILTVIHTVPADVHKTMAALSNTFDFALMSIQNYHASLPSLSHGTKLLLLYYSYTITVSLCYMLDVTILLCRLQLATWTWRSESETGWGRDACWGKALETTHNLKTVNLEKCL